VGRSSKLRSGTVGASVYMSFGEVVDAELCESSSSRLVLMGEKSITLIIKSYYFLLDFCWASFLIRKSARRRGCALGRAWRSFRY
jgi:hypothetical protein